MMEALKLKGCGMIGSECPKFLFCGLVLMIAIEASPAASPVSTDSPLGFFTNVASRLLLSEMNLNLTQIEIYPTNQYTSAVQRVLQVTANVYDATTTNFYPSIFRPLFTVDTGGNVFISGYTNQSTLIDHGNQMNDIAPPVDVTSLLPGTNILANVYGVPWIIGAKKGLPNFNAFDVESAFELVRKLEVQRDLAASTQPDILWTNQMYQMNLTNYLALSCWNSYQSNYPGPVDIVVRCSSAIELTNDDNMALYFPLINFAQAQELTPNWPAWGGVPKQQSPSFAVPLNESVVTLNNAVYVYTEHNLFPTEGVYTNYFDQGIRELPHFWLLMTNRLQVAIIDYSTNVSPLNAGGPTVGRIVDYVQLGGMDSSELLNVALPENDSSSLWNTNYVLGNLIGVYNQIQVSEYGTTITGQTPMGLGVWSSVQIPGGPANDTSPAAQQAFFRGFFSKDGSYSYLGTTYVNTQSVMQAPYTPFAFAIQHTTWEANDPLVHYLASDLAPHTEFPRVVDFNAVNLQAANDRYQPWGVAPPAYVNGVDANPSNLSYKDPLVRSSDNWDFPTGNVATVNWLGRVHRGTPWQTIFLKSTNILAWASQFGQNGLNTWMNWTGDFDSADAVAMAPVQDWHMASLLVSLLQTNDPASSFSVNNPDPNAWLALLDGLTAFTNNLPNLVVGIVHTQQFATIAISSNSPQAAIIATAIESARGNQPGQIFPDIGSILAIPQLAAQSPFLNWSNAAQQSNGISDEAYEAIPSQLLPLLRADSFGSVAPADGQMIIRFTGFDGHDYAIEMSADLMNWTRISTNSPYAGMINFAITPAMNAGAQFYRSISLN